MLPETQAKLDRLESLLFEMESVLVAFSGGADSALLLHVAHRALGERAVAATGLSGSYAPEEMAEAVEVARQIGARHLHIETMELTDSRYADNTHQRCFFCKSELYTKLKAAAAAEGINWVVDGANADDTGDFRPGMRAAARARCPQSAARSWIDQIGDQGRVARVLTPDLGQACRGLLVISLCVWRPDHR